MESTKEIYSDFYYSIRQCEEYPYVPGFYTIIENRNKWYSSRESINRLAFLEKKLREILLSIGAELVGIYKEENEEGKTTIFVIPFYVSELVKNNILPDLYQPYILEYLNQFGIEYISKVNEINEIIMKKLKKR